MMEEEYALLKQQYEILEREYQVTLNTLLERDEELCNVKKLIKESLDENNLKMIKFVFGFFSDNTVLDNRDNSRIKDYINNYIVKNFEI